MRKDTLSVMKPKGIGFEVFYIFKLAFSRPAGLWAGPFCYLVLPVKVQISLKETLSHMVKHY